jgi:hypothetical protein
MVLQTIHTSELVDTHQTHLFVATLIRMSQVISWLGNAEYGVAGNRLLTVVPFNFNPRDISGLQLWLDANDGSTIVDNPFGTVLSWSNKGDLSGNFDLSGTADVRIGDNRVNGLNVVTFNANAYMTGNFAMNFQDRSLFIVSKRNTVIDSSGGIGVFTWLTGDTSGAIESGVVYDVSANTFQYIVSKHPGFAVELDFLTSSDTTGYAELATFVNSSTDLSANFVALNSVGQTPIVSNLASGYATSNLTYFLGNYFGGSSLANDYDLCEVIMYDTALSATDIGRVQEYLTAKWAIANPPTPTPPVPVPFSPSDISGLQVWMDGSNAGSLFLSGTDILSWTNVGSAGESFIKSNGLVTYSNSQAEFNTGATLDVSGMTLPYYSRTAFGVFDCKSDLSTIAYPYVNIQGTNTSQGRQFGIAWDSNTSNYLFQICQAGINCPVNAPFYSLPIGLNLFCGVVDSNDASNNAGYFNNGSNINTSTDLGNLFENSNIPYYIGSTDSNSPAFQMAEFIEYDSVLSPSNISTVTSYLSDKWGLNL